MEQEAGPRDEAEPLVRPKLRSREPAVPEARVRRVATAAKPDARPAEGPGAEPVLGPREASPEEASAWVPAVAAESNPKRSARKEGCWEGLPYKVKRSSRVFHIDRDLSDYTRY